MILIDLQPHPFHLLTIHQFHFRRSLVKQSFADPFTQIVSVMRATFDVRKFVFNFQYFKSGHYDEQNF